MADNQSLPIKVERRLVGSALDLGSQTVTPVARLSGYAGSGGGEGGAGGGAWLKITPLEVLVARQDGGQESLALAGGAEAVPMRAMAGFGLLIGVVGIVLLLMLQRK